MIAPDLTAALLGSVGKASDCVPSGTWDSHNMDNTASGMLLASCLESPAQQPYWLLTVPLRMTLRHGRRGKCTKSPDVAAISHSVLADEHMPAPEHQGIEYAPCMRYSNGITMPLALLSLFATG